MGKAAVVQESSSNYLPTVYPEVPPPFAQQTVVLSKQEHLQLIQKANYWKSQHDQAIKRLAALKIKLEEALAQILDLKQRLWGKKSEKSSKKSEDSKGTPSKPRGQQVGSAGHGRTARPELPVVEEFLDLSDEEKKCSNCGKDFEPFPDTEDSDITEVEVKAYTRRIRRKRYQGCRCGRHPGIITAPPAPRLIPKGSLGISVWLEVLLKKYLFSHPTNRLCKDLAYLGAPIAQGTITGGLKRISPLFDSLIEAMLTRQLSESLFHCDETTWKVFELVEGKVNHKWYLWVNQSPSVVFYYMAPGRGAKYPKKHFSSLSKESGAGKEMVTVFLICDRYIVYQCVADEYEVVVLAFCWVHVRRDFLEGARSWPDFHDWMFSWKESIGELYHLNKKRLKHFDETKAVKEQSSAFQTEHRRLSTKLEEMAKRFDTELKDEKLPEPKKKLLESLKKHWAGLIVFRDHPQVPMDNNSAERALRNQVCGRRNYYGSGSVWSAELAAKMFTVLGTIELWGLNPRHYLHSFLTACAENGGGTPSDLSPFLPWEMDEARRAELARPLPSSIQTIDSS